jgi:hypothetical protein
MKNNIGNDILTHTEFLSESGLLPPSPRVPSADFQNVFFRQLCAALISSLFVWRGPSAIVRRISGIRIPSIKAMLFAWCAPHVGQERHKIVSPGWTHQDATTAVVAIILAFLVIAAFFHSHPSLVFLGSQGAILESFAVYYFSHAVIVSNPGDNFNGVEGLFTFQF